MKPNLSLAGVLLGSLVLAACTGAPESHVVNFKDVGSVQKGGDFTLHVKVFGVDNSTAAIPGAFVGAAKAHSSTPLAKGTTDANGEAALILKRGQTIRLVAEAE